MSKDEKRIKKMRQNLKNVRFEDLEKLLENIGYRQSKSSGSHRVFKLKRKGLETSIIPIPIKRPHLKQNYVKDTLSQLEDEGIIENNKVIYYLIDEKK